MTTSAQPIGHAAMLQDSSLAIAPAPSTTEARTSYYRPGITFKGEHNGRAKLNALQVVEIFQSRERQKDIARRYGVTPSLVSHIKARKVWPHLFEALP